MTDLDFSGVEPLRVAEAGRRLAVIDEYLRLPAPRTKDMVEYGRRLDLSRWQFQRLVRTWREHRDVAMLVVGRRGPATRDYGVDPRAILIAEQVIAETGAAAELSNVAPEIERRCERAGIVPLSRPGIWNYIARARTAGAAAIGGPPRIVIGRLWFHLPVQGQTEHAMPSLLVATMLPERHVVAHRLSLDETRPPSIADLLRLLLESRSPGAAERRILMSPNDRRAAAGVLEETGLMRVKPHDRSTQRELSHAFGTRLGSLNVLYRRGPARPSMKRVVKRQDAPLAPDEATAAILHAIRSHNAALASYPPAFDVADG